MNFSSELLNGAGSVGFRPGDGDEVSSRFVDMKLSSIVVPIVIPKLVKCVR